MTTDIATFILLILSLMLIIGLLFIILKKIKRSQLKSCFIFILSCMLICLVGLISQCLLGYKLNIPLIYYDYFVYIGTVFLPVGIFLLGLIFANTKVKFKKSYLLLFIIPVISLIMLWTNDFHNLFYIQYSTNINATTYGPYVNIHSVYTYLMYALGLITLLKYSIKNSGFFSRQALLFILSALIPIALNILAGLGFINATVYLTPISFTLTILLCAFAVFKFDFLKVTPIAMQRIVDRMSDSFLVINEDDNITDFNDTFLRTFKLKTENVRNISFLTFVSSQNLEGIDTQFLNSILDKCKTTSEIIVVKREMKILDHYFNIEASGIFSKGSFLGTLVLLKDVTQHVHDRTTIENNQNILMERERLASLGQLIGGIAHNLKTPIMSIAGAAEGLTDLTTEYEKSVGDPEVTVQDHHEIAKDMKDWIEKIRSYTEYMSDVITAVKGQAVTMSDEQAVSFTLDELVKRVNILMRHELKKALVDLNIQMKAEPDTILKGNINSLVQVINNMISNAIQAYNGEAGHEINLILELSGKNIIISVQDFANGLPESIASKLFKEMITTKGKNGTGLGLFMSYSTIRAHFNGNVTFETEKGKGTVFHISLPV
ncbi:MAG: hypothetical protein HFJ30_03715 [Clostridia bacterium]|nr:hypothetical protein [Clostridia bacterium]